MRISILLAVTLLASNTAVAKTPDIDGADGASVWISGRVVSTQGDAFTMRSGIGEIVVEVDGGQAAELARGIKSGHKVSVYGRLDNDLFESQKMEASSVYNADTQTHYFASAADEEGAPRIVSYPYSYIRAQTEFLRLSGRVTEIDPSRKRVIIDAGGERIHVSVGSVHSNPLRHDRIEVGTRVSVFGRPTEDFVTRKEIEAVSIIPVVQSKKRTR